eukprot:4281261-Pleurochrysis_carterae.AAC.1
MRVAGPPPTDLRAWPSKRNPPWGSPRPERSVLASKHARSAKDGRLRRMKTGDTRRPPRSHACFGRET